MSGALDIHGRKSKQEILIVGGSLTGLTCALACARDFFEKRQQAVHEYGSGKDLTR